MIFWLNSISFDFKDWKVRLKDCKVDLRYKDNNGFTALHYLLIGDISLFEKKEFWLALIKQNSTFEKKNNAMSDDNDKHDTFFEGTTVGIGFVYTVILLAIVGCIFAFG